MDLHVISAGAAQMFINQTQDTFALMTDHGIDARFGSAGGMKELFLSGLPCDVLILTDTLIEHLSDSGHLVPETVRPIGNTSIGIAVPSGAPKPDISSAQALRTSLLASEGIYFADGQRGTAGRHVMYMMQNLNILEQAQSSFRQYPNGPVAMAHLAESTEKNAVGCTQISEIFYTENVELVGPLPAELALTTRYSIAVCSSSNNQALAKTFIETLTSKDSDKIRTNCGFNVLAIEYS